MENTNKNPALPIVINAMCNPTVDYNDFYMALEWLNERDHKIQSMKDYHKSFCDTELPDEYFEKMIDNLFYKDITKRKPVRKAIQALRQARKAQNA